MKIETKVKGPHGSLTLPPKIVGAPRDLLNLSGLLQKRDAEARELYKTVHGRQQSQRSVTVDQKCE